MQEITPANFKISCSHIGEIMGKGGPSKDERIAEMQQDIKIRTEKRDALRDGLKSKLTATEKINTLTAELEAFEKSDYKPELPKGAKTFCEQWLKIAIYERTPEFTSKYTDKGNETEQDAIELLNRFYGWNAKKNTTRTRCDFMHGECDLELPDIDMIVDIKSPFSCWTFPLFDAVIPEKKYEYQIQGYMHLYGRANGRVSYCLMDMPEDMIAKELRWKFPAPPTDEEYRAARQQYIYSDLADVLRVKSFDFKYDPELIAAVEKRVLECREYIGSLFNNM